MKLVEQRAVRNLKEDIRKILKNSKDMKTKLNEIYEAVKDD
jgi:hypothetical protein